MARCKACGTEAAATARFCSICGAAVAAPAPTPSPTLPPPPRSSPIRTAAPTPTGSPAYGAPQAAPAGNGNGKTALWIGSGLLVVCAAGFLFAKSSGLLGAKSPGLPQSQVLAAPQTQAAPAPVLGAPRLDAPKSPVMSQPDPIGSPMPEDIIAYLRWLKALNGRLQTMHSDTVSMSTGILTTLYGDIANMASETDAPDPSKPPNTSATVQKLQKIVQDLNVVTGEFQGRTPPNPCAPLATEYNKALATTVTQTASMAQVYTKLINALAKDASQGTAESQTMLPDLMREMNGGGMSKSADAGFNSSDASLNALRDRYTQIPSDIAPGNFQLKSLDTGFDPKSMLRGLPGGMGGTGAGGGMGSMGM